MNPRSSGGGLAGPGVPGGCSRWRCPHRPGRAGAAVRGPRVTAASAVQDVTEVRLVRGKETLGPAVRRRPGGRPLAADRLPASTSAQPADAYVAATTGHLTVTELIRSETRVWRDVQYLRGYRYTREGLSDAIGG